jgi:MYXO-CTERM domain-containing protein
MHARQAKGNRALARAFVLGVLCTLVPTPARAHFVLDAPASWAVLDPTLGVPEKLGPCGNEGPTVLAVDDAGAPIVTAFQEGGKITVTITEVVFHPGHYRISLSTTWADAGDMDQAGFPDDPVVTPGATNSGTMMCPLSIDSACGSVPIVQGTPVAVPGVGWILADDVFEHCDEFPELDGGALSPQTITLDLPAGVTCKECVIQVLEFMSSHGPNVPGGCFYHHCANISISANSSGTTSQGAGTPPASGCSCSISPQRGFVGGLLAALVAAAGFARRRRRAC